MTQVSSSNGEKLSIDEGYPYKEEHYQKVVDKETLKYSWYNKSNDDKLSTTYPNATSAERLRFSISRKGDIDAASKLLGEYLQWRKDMGLEEDNNNDGQLSILAKKDNIITENPSKNVDDILWYFATSIAYTKLNECNLKDPNVKTLPRIISLSDSKMRSLDGSRIIQFLGARVDLDLANASVYALAGAIFVALIQDRQSMEKFVVILDARPGRGWRNHAAKALVPFIKKISNLLSVYHPERMKITFLFPLPYIANMIWYCVKPFLDPVTAKKIQLYSGSATIVETPPKELKNYFSEDVIDYLEKSRKALFTNE